MWTSKAASGRTQPGEAASPFSSSSGLWKEPSVTLLGWHLAFVDPVTSLNKLAPLFVMWVVFVFLLFLYLNFFDCVSEL